MNESNCLMKLRAENENFHTRYNKKSDIVVGNEVLTGWDSEAFCPDILKGAAISPFKFDRGYFERPKTQNSRRAAKEPEMQSSVHIKTKIMLLEQHERVKSAGKINQVGIFYMTPKLKNFMFTANREKILKMNKALKKNIVDKDMKNSMKIQSISPCSRINTPKNTFNKISLKKYCQKTYTRLKNLKSVIL